MLIFILFGGLTAFFVLCHKEGTGKQEQVMGTATTQIVKIDGLQMAFDLQSMDEHMKMMEHMNIAMEHEGEEDHFLTLTLIEKPANRLVTDAQVLFAVKVPDGSTLKKEATVMKGGSMFHYVTGFKASGAGKYAVDAIIKRGAAEYKPHVEFTIQ